MSLYQRNGWWYMDFVVNGKRTNRACGTRSKSKARVVQERERLAVLDKQDRRDGGMTLDEAFERAYRERWVHNKSNGALGHIPVILRVLGPDTLIGDVDGESFRLIQQHLVDKGRSLSTVNRYFSTLRTVLNLAHREWGLIDSVPYVKSHSEPKGRIRVITPDEEVDILGLMYAIDPTTEQLSDLVRVLIDTGLRLSEALGLTREDVDLDARTVTIWTQKGGGDLQSRTIPMTRRVWCTLRNYDFLQGPIFDLTVDQVERAWRTVRTKMGLLDDPQFTPHALRHTFASRLVRNGVPLYEVKELLGHSSITVTERYAHLNPNNHRKAIETLEESNVN